MKILAFPFVLLFGIFAAIIVSLLAVISLPIVIGVGYYKKAVYDYFDDWKEVFSYLYFIIFGNVLNSLKDSND